MAFSLYYRKTNNDELFQALEKSDFEISDLQNYVPLYDNFFSLNSTNYNSINLNQKYYLHSVTWLLAVGFGGTKILLFSRCSSSAKSLKMEMFARLKCV